MMVGDGLKGNNMENVVFLCVPASTRRKNTRRYQQFSSMVCSICGAEDGFSYLWRDSDYKAEHLSRGHYNPEAHTSQLLINEDKISGKKVVLFDDVCSSGHTMQAAIGEIQKHGGRVAIAITLGRTVHRA
jgi:predicted amidophosphoribosyltransferase